ncbi:MAG: hypothetical protein R6V04_17245 [bacterium]
MRVNEKIFKLVKTVISEQGLELVDDIITYKGGNAKIKFLIDRPGGVTLDECAEVSKKILEILDTHEQSLNFSSYRLEVSSPGEDYPLTTGKDFSRKMGEKVLVKYYKDDEIKEITGKIENVDDENLAIDLGVDVLTVPINKIKDGKIKYDL